MTSKAAVALLAFAAPAVCGLHSFESVEPHMGTLVRIQIYTTGEARARTAFRAAFDRIAALDAALSDYRPESELNRLCRAAVGRPVVLSADLFRVLVAAQRLASQTDGAFDVTIGPLTRLWRDARKAGRVPTPESLAEAKARTGYRKLHLDPMTGTARLDQSGMQLDLGGIAKGFAADEALDVLTRLGIRRALIAVSGDLAFGYPPPGRDRWKIAIPSGVLELADAAVSTSGDAEQHLDAAGRRFSHILDPATGFGLTNSRNVSVIARRGIDADALATAASIRGMDALGCRIISESEIDCSARPSIDVAHPPAARRRRERSPNPPQASRDPGRRSY